MKMKLECMKCFMDQAVRAARFSSEEYETQLMAVREAARLIGVLDPEKSPPETATGIFRAVAEVTQNPDGFREVKSVSNSTVRDLLPEVSGYIASSADPFEAAVKISLCGNIIDHGIFDDFDVAALIREETGKPADRRKIGRLKEIIGDASRICFLADNAGEIGLDGLLLDEFMKINPGLEVSVLVKSGPIINDATLEDAEYFSLEKKYRILTTPATVGVNLRQLTGPAAEAAAGADWIISKGQANYELLSGLSPARVVYLLRAKCAVVAEDIGVKVNSPVIIINQ